ncbi:MAG TPA: ABC transporter ATP-binding protein [Opitutae bacterium]|nr:ABC transporter ATP-binding protein [Opitutae bacterium]|tara:strand:- start:12134 stop:12808 length:675 start_codon:yes stop_codon:yes gene_type:complete
MNTIISLNKISKTYFQGTQRIEVLCGLNLDVKSSEAVAILGQSGTGKSTLLSLLAGLDVPDFGTVEVNKQDLSKLSQDKLSQFRAKNLGVIFQQYHLMSNLTALENVGIPLELQKVNDFQSAALEALKMVGLSHRIAHFPSQLSGGECQRVAIARAIVGKPKLILADEPSGNLDDKTGKEVMNLLFELCKEREQTLILVTHNHDLAQNCDRTLVLKDGKLAPRK